MHDRLDVRVETGPERLRAAPPATARLHLVVAHIIIPRAFVVREGSVDRPGDAPLVMRAGVGAVATGIAVVEEHVPHLIELIDRDPDGNVHDSPEGGVRARDLR